MGRIVPSPALICCATFALVSSANAQNPGFANKWHDFDFDRKLMRAGDLAKMDSNHLGFLRAIIFGKHGRVFNDHVLQNFLDGESWYEFSEDFSNSELNSVERRNLDLVRGEEAKRHRNVRPGDLRFWRTRKFTTKLLSNPSLLELHIMAAEIEAIHGKRFDDEPALQRYFQERYWYEPASKYDPKKLSGIELANLATVRSLAKVKRNLRIMPGDMVAVQNETLTDKHLIGLTLYELRVLRNEIYALRGLEFRTGWLQSHFWAQDWYREANDPSEVKLSRLDHQNVATILKYENRLHDELATKPVKLADLYGLFLEDARKLRYEIEARHGKVWKTRWIQSYFDSLSWYQRNPSYSPKALTAIERQNLAVVAEYEKEATSAFLLVEG